MFAVKGWNISAPLKAQTTTSSSKKGSEANSSKASKKRKRESVQNDKTAQPKEWTGLHQERKDVLNGVKSGNKTKEEKGKKKDNVKDTEITKSAPSDVTPKDQAIKDQSMNGDDTEGKRKKRKRNKKKKEGAEDETEGHSNAPTDPQAKPSKASALSAELPLPPAQPNLTPLQSAMRQKLISSRFRYLNETLYTTPSADSLELFRSNPTFFTEYHEGFARQVGSWPENPVDGFAALLAARGRVQSKGYTPGKLKGLSNDTDAVKLRDAADHLSRSPSRGDISMGITEPLPRDPKSRDTTVIDLGCGTAALAQQLQPFKESLRLQLYSYDLAAQNEFVKVADIRNLPIPEASVDIAVFSLALMGTNWVEFVEEAWRVLRWRGECWVADVNSRFAGQLGARMAGGGKVLEHSVGARVKNPKASKPPQTQSQPNNIEDDGLADEEGVQRREGTDVSAFVAVLRRRGFVLVGEPDVSNRMFARMRFTKSLTPTRGKCSRTKERRGGPIRRKFIDKKDLEDDITVEDEAKVLKPCVYKTR